MDRRNFLSMTAAALAASSTSTALAATSIPGSRTHATPSQIHATPKGAPLTVQDIINALLADIPGAPFPNTVDTIKAGNPNTPVKGIVTTMFATNEIIGKAIDLKANFIIAHEPTFYNHADETKWLSDDPVYKYKRDLLDSHGIVVWRFHDGIHTHIPDGVRMGVLQALGWDKYYKANDPFLIELPAPIPLGQLLAHCKKGLDITKLKFIGDPTQDCKRIVLSPGAPGGHSQIANIEKYQPDCFITGELNEWETNEYVRDARIQGRKLSLIVLGHAVSEEPGMEWLVPVLKQKAPGIPVTHLPSGDPFSFY